MTQHGRPTGTPEPSSSPAVRAPSHAERARTLVADARSATLATHARDPDGHPYASLVAFASDERGRPLLLLSELAEHTGNLRARPESSILVAETPRAVGAEALALGRVTLIGETRPIPDEERAATRATFMEAQPRASLYVDFKDFAFYRLEPKALRYVGGFGRMSWVTAADYAIAAPDALREAARGILDHMNADHADACLAYARALAGVADATGAVMTAVDRYGFELEIATPAGPRAARLAFDDEALTSGDARRALIALLERARAAG